MTRFLSARAVARLAAVATVLALPACASFSDVQGNERLGSINLTTASSNTGPYAATAVATFFTSQPQTLPSSRVTSDQCGTFNYVPESFVPGNLEAGAEIQLQVGGNAYSLTQPSNLPRVYTLGDRRALHSPGDTARVTIPGVAGGFPGATIALRMAEPVLITNEIRADSAQDVAVAWQPNGDANSSIILSFRFTGSLSSVNPDRQVLCIVRDNGAYTVPGGTMGEYFASNPASRSLNIMRWRTNSAVVDERTQLYIVSTIDTTLVLPGE